MEKLFLTSSFYLFFVFFVVRGFFLNENLNENSKRSFFPGFKLEGPRDENVACLSPTRARQP